ncbi:MAG: CpsB/CapC family capsule biosynthesis tyrosine phosphatase [Methyloceanibacter sp.]
MIDLHCHILPGIDDGAADLAVSMAMARAFVADGVSVVACTPHILPGLYSNSGPEIRKAVARLQQTLDRDGIPLRLVTGADNHIVPSFVAELRSGHLLSLADTRYVLVEPPHHIPPPRMEDLFFSLLIAGCVPILTHPERLTWIQAHYDAIQRLVRGGVWMQITAGSLAGAFGRNARYWGERMLDEGCVHILATDAHDVDRRPPNLNLGRELAAKRVGDLEAQNLVETRPAGVLRNDLPTHLPLPNLTVASSGIVYSKSGVITDTRDVAGPGHSCTDRGAADRSFAGRLRRFFR